ncbi:MAG: hypothetical protein WCX30_02835 [Candidatus Paceibacterota bacterium]|jgi:hypothetical protein|nr:hypothetical protein [bacterium]
MFIDELNLFLTSTELNNFLLPFKVLSVILAIAFIYGANKYYKIEKFAVSEWVRKYNHFFHLKSPAETKTIPERFQNIIDLINKKNQIDTKMALVKNQYLLWDILKEMKLTEEMLGELSEEQFPNVSAVKDLIEIADYVKQDPSYTVNIGRTRELFILMRDSLIKLHII